MDLDVFSIQNAAAGELENLKRTSYSGNGFSFDEVSAIASAIAAAIAEYNRQLSQKP